MRPGCVGCSTFENPVPSQAGQIAARKSGLGWTYVANACGFADQAHLIHDFGMIVGGTPAEFFSTTLRWTFGGACAAPDLADSYNPFIV